MATLSLRPISHPVDRSPAHDLRPSTPSRVWAPLGAWFATERAERLRLVIAQSPRPAGKSLLDGLVFPHEPCEVPKAVLHDLGQVHPRRRAGRVPARQLSPCDELDLVVVGDVPGWLDGHEEREQDQLARDPPGCGVHHDRHEPKLGHGVDDGFVRVQVWIPRRLHGLPPVGGEVSDPFLVEVAQNGFERWRVHTRTLPATRCSSTGSSSSSASHLRRARRRVRRYDPDSGPWARSPAPSCSRRAPRRNNATARPATTTPDTSSGARPADPHARPAHTPAISAAPPASPWYRPSPLPTRSSGRRSAIHALPTPPAKAV